MYWIGLVKSDGFGHRTMFCSYSLDCIENYETVAEL